MTEILSDTRRVEASRQRIWRMFHDPEALASIIPGAESIEPVGEGAFRGVLASRIQFMTIRADVEATLADRLEPSHLTLQMRGRPRGLAGTFSVMIDVDLVGDDADDPPHTDLRYVVDMVVTGRLASFGTPILRDTLRRQIAQLAANVDAYLASEVAAHRG